MIFEKDIFISYAHLDDEVLTEGDKGWISEFHKALEVRLGQLLGAKPVIWRDSRLQGNDFFTPEIMAQFKNPENVTFVRHLNWCVFLIKILST